MTVKKRIIVSSIVATVALSALSLSITLAWYASSDRLNVSAFDVRIKGGNNLLISNSSDLDTFKETLERSKEKHELNEVDLFVPVSSMHKNLWMDEKSDTPCFYDNSFYNVPATGIPQIKRVERGFFQQKIYLLSNISYYITVSASVDEEGNQDSYFESDVKANEERAEKLYQDNQMYTKEEYLQKLNNLKNSLRMSILIPDEEYYSYFVIDPHKKENEEIVFAGRLDNDNDGYYDTYEYLQDGQVVEKETVYGEVINRENMIYEAPTGEPVQPLPEKDHFDGNSFIGISKGSAYTYNEEESLKDGKVIYAKEESLSFDDLNKETNPLLIPCFAGVPREIIISIYMEGWDQDCVNATMGASFINNISFKLAKGGLEQ